MSAGLNRNACILFLALCVHSTPAAALQPDFAAGSKAYREGRYEEAASIFQQLTSRSPAPGSFQNLGNAEWRLGRTGPAIVAWEQALWIDPFHTAARDNLRFARRTAQVESPNLTWYEVVSTWLPSGWWAAVAGISLWLAIGISMLPGILRWQRASWHQAVAAASLAVFLLSLPAHAGVISRSRLGFALAPNTPLRLTPTEEAQAVTYLGAGEPGRLVRQRGAYLLVRTPRSLGWVKKEQFGFISPRIR